MSSRRLLSFLGIAVIVIACLCSSCGNTRRLVYLQGKFDTAALSKIKLTDPMIQKGDILSILVYSDNPQLTAIYNQSQVSVGTNSGGTGGENAPSSPSTPTPLAAGYLVDERGNIEFQGLGTLHVEGLTRDALKDTLDARLRGDILKNPYFSIRFINYKFTMLGELMKPGVYSIPGEHINILQALGLAGDMTPYGRRENVLILREVGGTRQYGRLDLTKPEVMASPYFYLQQNDVVIVEPIKAKAASSDLTARNISIAATVVTALAVILNLIKN